MKNFKQFMAIALILSGVAYSLYNAANEYGLYTNNLHENVAAQSDDTSGETTNGGTCIGSDVIQCSSYLHRELKPTQVTSNSEGTLNILGVNLGGYKKNTTYTAILVDYSCRTHTYQSNFCDTRKERTEFLTLSEGGTTTNN